MSYLDEGLLPYRKDPQFANCTQLAKDMGYSSVAEALEHLKGLQHYTRFVVVEDSFGRVVKITDLKGGNVFRRVE